MNFTMRLARSWASRSRRVKRSLVDLDELPRYSVSCIIIDGFHMQENLFIRSYRLLYDSRPADGRSMVQR